MMKLITSKKMKRTIPAIYFRFLKGKYLSCIHFQVVYLVPINIAFLTNAATFIQHEA